MKKLLLFFGLTLLISCVGANVQNQNPLSEESSANEDTVADTWGQIPPATIEAPPETSRGSLQQTCLTMCVTV